MVSWLISISVEDWNYFLDKRRYDDLIKTTKLSIGDAVCFYVRGTSSIKGVARVGNGKSLAFQKVGDVNYFGIASSLSFVKEKDSVVKYLKNFNGVANLGRPIPEPDMILISSQITTQEIPEAKVQEVPSVLQVSQIKNDSTYETIFTLENSLREFIVKRLKTISKNWEEERIPDPKILEEWRRRRDQDKKQRRWFEEEQEVDLINYSDFYDLVTLIVNRGNWSKCFEKVFGKQSIIESKMYELIPIRNKIAHNRPLSEEEIMALKLYSSQILRLIKSDN